MVSNGLAGGVLLEELRRVLLQRNIIDNILNKRNRRGSNYKKTALNIIINGNWRSRLEQSMSLANKLLNSKIEGLESAGYDVADLSFYLASPGLIGIGSGIFKAIFEVGLEMDWLLGLPVIRGSSLKGAARVLIEEAVDNAPGLSESLDVFFGTAGKRGRQGAVIVLDSYPVGCRPGYPCLVLTGDVVTPHYYKGGKAVDSEAKAEPKPVQHVTIAPGTVFRVVAGVPGRDLEPGLDSHAEKILRAFGVEPAHGVPARLYALGVLLQAALANGLGARSGKGYNILLPYTSDVLETRVVKIRLSTPEGMGSRRDRGGPPGRGRRGPEKHYGRGGRSGRERW